MTKTRLERFALGLLLAPVAPLAGLIGCWWLSYAILPENWIPYGAITGLLVGVVVDALALGKILDRAHRLKPAFWVAVLLFYSMGLFGVIMGVPILNVALAVPAGFVVGGRLVHEKAAGREVRAAALRTSILTAGVLAVVCAASAVVALMSASTAGDLQGMLGLDFAVTPAMIWGLILVGGAGLLAVDWVLTGLSVRLTYRFLSTP